MTLPGFDVHQDFDNVLMNGERNGERIGTESANTDEFKLEALRLAASVGINQAAKRLGMPSSSLGNWARLKRSGKLGDLPRASPIKGSPTELEAENNCLGRELANAKLDLEIVKNRPRGLRAPYV